MNAPDTGADMGHPADAAEAHDPTGEERLRQLVHEQAALRRVATLVAGRARPTEVFGAVADELGRVIGAEATFITSIDLSSPRRPRVPAAAPSGELGELEGYLTVVGSYGRVRLSHQRPGHLSRRRRP